MDRRGTYHRAAASALARVRPTRVLAAALGAGAADVPIFSRGAARLIELAPMPNAITRRAQPSDVDQIISGYEWLFEPPASQPVQWNPERATAALRRAILSD